MAVENKFKLNVIAASVLMGLSLSAVAAVEAPKTPATETTPTKPEVKTLAGLTPPESAAKVSVTVKDFNGNAATTLEKILDDTTEGSVANLRKSYTDAKGVYDKLSPAQQKIITDLNTAASDKNKKTQAWNDFGNKLSAANSVYTENLNSLYGEEHNGFKVGNDGTVKTDFDDNSTYGKLVSAYHELKASVGNLNKALVGDHPEGYLGNALGAFTKAEGGVKKVAQTAEAKVIAYSNYINKVIDVKERELQLELVRSSVINNISTVLYKTDQSEEIADTSKGVGKALDEFKSAYSNWSNADQPNKAAQETILATKFQDLVSAASLDSTVLSNQSDATLGNLASAWKTLTGSDITTGSVAEAQAAERTAMDFTQASSVNNSANKAISDFSGSHSSLLADVDPLIQSDSPQGLDDAVSKLQAAYQVLFNKDGKGNGATQEELTKLQGLIAKALGDHQALSAIQDEYKEKNKSLQQAGASRLNLLVTELPEQQKAFLKAQSDYQTAMNNLKDANAAKDAYDALYGEDGQSGALGNLLTSLKNTSAGIENALTEAESTYKSIAGNSTKPRLRKTRRFTS